MNIDKDKLEGLRSLLKRAYIEGYLQGAEDNDRQPYSGTQIADAEDRWEGSELPLYLEFVERGFEV